MRNQDRTLELNMKNKIENTIDLICKKFEIKSIDINFKYMEEKSLYSVKDKTIVISKDYLENFYYCLALIINELIKMDLSENIRLKLPILYNAFNILSKKKIISPDIKEELLNLGFKEVNIGSKIIHEINSKELMLDFFGYDIAIGIYARYISYGCNRLYRALIYEF